MFKRLMVLIEVCASVFCGFFWLASLNNLIEGNREIEASLFLAVVTSLIYGATRWVITGSPVPFSKSSNSTDDNAT
jgi:hypothetical protein